MNEEKSRPANHRALPPRYGAHFSFPSTHPLFCVFCAFSRPVQTPNLHLCSLQISFTKLSFPCTKLELTRPNDSKLDLMPQKIWGPLIRLLSQIQPAPNI